MSFFQSMVDEKGLDAIQKLAHECQEAIHNEQWINATFKWHATQQEQLRQSSNGDVYNILEFKPDKFNISKKEGTVRRHVHRDIDAAYELFDCV